MNNNKIIVQMLMSFCSLKNAVFEPIRYDDQVISPRYNYKLQEYFLHSSLCCVQKPGIGVDPSCSQRMA